MPGRKLSILLNALRTEAMEGKIDILFMVW